MQPSLTMTKPETEKHAVRAVDHQVEGNHHVHPGAEKDEADIYGMDSHGWTPRAMTLRIACKRFQGNGLPGEV